MRFIRITAAALVILTLGIRPSGADEVFELKVMVQQLRSDYESKIQSLEAKIGQLEASQEQRVTDQVTQLREEIKKEIKDEEKIKSTQKIVLKDESAPPPVA